MLTLIDEMIDKKASKIFLVVDEKPS